MPTGHDGPGSGTMGRATAEPGPDGAPITDLMAACGMGRSWVYYRLREHAQAGRAVQTTRGAWRGHAAGGRAVPRGTPARAGPPVARAAHAVTPSAASPSTAPRAPARVRMRTRRGHGRGQPRSVTTEGGQATRHHPPPMTSNPPR